MFYAWLKYKRLQFELAMGIRLLQLDQRREPYQQTDKHQLRPRYRGNVANRSPESMQRTLRLPFLVCVHVRDWLLRHNR